MGKKFEGHISDEVVSMAIIFGSLWIGYPIKEGSIKWVTQKYV